MQTTKPDYGLGASIVYEAREAPSRKLSVSPEPLKVAYDHVTVVVGLGPHAKRIYMPLFRKFGFEPRLVIELESKRPGVFQYITTHRTSCHTYFIPDEYRDVGVLPEDIADGLRRELSSLGVTHAIISTEPKAHLAFLRFFLAEGISVLVDKPITAPVGPITSIHKARAIESEYGELIGRYRSVKYRGVTCEVQCQRRYHRGYAYVKELLEQCVASFGVPVTSLDVYHCDGTWNMPGEFLSRENHPYKYGYGKLLHSGYHFIDLVSWLLQVNEQLPTKHADNVQLYAAAVRPYDFLSVIDNDDYARLFPSHRHAGLLSNLSTSDLEQMGELDCYSVMQFRKGSSTMTTCTLNLLQTGYSRRAWMDLPEDTYKGNGRVRHERMNVHVGPLMNIQIHSYQSKEIKDRDASEAGEEGSVEHFDISIFRNIGIIGGEPYRHVQLHHLDSPDGTTTLIGHNERARERCFVSFLRNESRQSDLCDHRLSIKLLSRTYESLCHREAGRSPVITFGIR